MPNRTHCLLPHLDALVLLGDGLQRRKRFLGGFPQGAAARCAVPREALPPLLRVGVRGVVDDLRMTLLGGELGDRCGGIVPAGRRGRCEAPYLPPARAKCAVTSRCLI